MTRDIKNKNKPLVASFGRYKAIKKLGEGSMGCVYLAMDPVLERQLAIKVISLEKQLDEKTRGGYLKRFVLEAKATAKLNHQSIVSVYDAGEQDGFPWIAFEYVKGESLAELLEKKDKLKIEQAVSIAIDIASALKHAHKFGIIHRDIKPANILLDSETGIAKLADFGIVKAPHTALTQDGNILGSPGYMSPEQIKGEKLDDRSDMFSLGIVIYQMVSGIHPFLRDDVIKTLYATINGDCKSLKVIMRKIPNSLERAISKCMTTEKDARIETADDLINMLKNNKTNKTNRPRIAVDAVAGGANNLLKKILPKKQQLQKTSKFVIKKNKKTPHSLFKWLKKLPRTVSIGKTQIADIINTGQKIPERIFKHATKTKKLKLPSKAFRQMANWFKSIPVYFSFKTKLFSITAQQKKWLLNSSITLCIIALFVLFLFFFGFKNSASKPSYTSLSNGIAKTLYLSGKNRQLIETGFTKIKNGNYEEVKNISQTLSESKSTVAYSYLFSGLIALNAEDYDNANILFQNGKKQKRGRKIIDSHLETILQNIEKEISEEQARQALITLVAVTLKSAEHPIVKNWLASRNHWTRWNAVAIQEYAGLKIDMVPLYILDLRYSGSMKTRINAAEMLGESRDDRAIKPLTEAKNKGFRDPFVSTTASTMLENYFE